MPKICYVERAFSESSLALVQAVRDLLNRRGRLAEMEQAPLSEARAAAQAVVEQIRQTGKVSPEQRRQLETALAALPESDQDALLDWLEQQLGQARRMRRQQGAEPVVRPEL